MEIIVPFNVRFGFSFLSFFFLYQFLSIVAFASVVYQKWAQQFWHWFFLFSCCCYFFMVFNLLLFSCFSYAVSGRSAINKNNLYFIFFFQIRFFFPFGRSFVRIRIQKEKDMQLKRFGLACWEIDQWFFF